MAELTVQQKQHLFEQGWVVIPQVVPTEMVRAARHAINSTIENYMDSIQTRAHELKTDKRLTDLLMGTDAYALIESALGKGKVVASTTFSVRFAFQISKARILRSDHTLTVSIRRLMGIRGALSLSLRSPAFFSMTSIKTIPVISPYGLALIRNFPSILKSTEPILN